MAELIVVETLAAARRVIEMVETAQECEKECGTISSRVLSTITTVEKTLATIGHDDDLLKNLLDLKTLSENIQDVLQRCQPMQSSSALRKAAHNASRVFKAADNRNDLKKYSTKLADMERGIIGMMALVSITKQKVYHEEDGQQMRRIEDKIGLALKISEDTRSHPAVKLAQRQLKGNVIYNELTELDHVLGSGSFGVVKAGTYYGRPVAIKKALEKLYGPEDRENFRREASTHFILKHDRIVRVIAFSSGDDSHVPCLVMERMEHTLRYFLGVQSAELDLHGKLAYIIDVCEGLRYLHHLNVIHRDINSYNILLDGSGAKVSDFGLSHVCSTLRSTRNGSFLDEKAMGTNFWMAPEVFDRKESSFDSDIFSLHVVMWEIIEHRPGGKKHDPAIGYELLSAPHRTLELTGGRDAGHPAGPRLHKLVHRCGMLDRSRRPEISDVLREAKLIFDSLSGPGKGDVCGAGTASAQPENLSRSGSLPLSEERRRIQENGAFDAQESPWESWKELDSSRVEVESYVKARDTFLRSRLPHNTRVAGGGGDAGWDEWVAATPDAPSVMVRQVPLDNGKIVWRISPGQVARLLTPPGGRATNETSTTETGETGWRSVRGPGGEKGWLALPGSDSSGPPGSAPALERFLANRCVVDWFSPEAAGAARLEGSGSEVEDGARAISPTSLAAGNFWVPLRQRGPGPSPLSAAHLRGNSDALLLSAVDAGASKNDGRPLLVTGKWKVGLITDTLTVTTRTSGRTRFVATSSVAEDSDGKAEGGDQALAPLPVLVDGLVFGFRAVDGLLIVTRALSRPKGAAAATAPPAGSGTAHMEPVERQAVAWLGRVDEGAEVSFSVVDNGEGVMFSCQEAGSRQRHATVRAKCRDAWGRGRVALGSRSVTAAEDSAIGWVRVVSQAHGATVRSGMSVDADAVVGRIPCGTVVPYDSAVVYHSPGGPDHVIDPVVRYRCMATVTTPAGWISERGRYLDHPYRICEQFRARPQQPPASVSHVSIARVQPSAAADAQTPAGGGFDSLLDRSPPELAEEAVCGVSQTGTTAVGSGWPGCEFEETQKAGESERDSATGSGQLGEWVYEQERERDVDARPTEGNATTRLSVHARLPASCPYVGSFHYAPSAGNRTYSFFEGQIIPHRETLRLHKLLTNPLIGSFHIRPRMYGKFHILQNFHPPPVPLEDGATMNAIVVRIRSSLTGTSPSDEDTVAAVAEVAAEAPTLLRGAVDSSRRRAAKKAGDTAGGWRSMNTSLQARGSVGGASANAVRDSCLDGLDIASAMMDDAEELARNCPVPSVCEAATVMPFLIKLVSEGRGNVGGMEEGLARCRSIITLLHNAAKVFAKDSSSKGAAPRVLDNVRDVILDLVDLMKIFQSQQKLLKVLTSSLFRRRQEEANAAIDSAVIRHFSTEIPEDEVLISADLLGSGAFSAVYIGDYRGRNVACKVVQIKHGPRGMKDIDADEPSAMTESEKRQHKQLRREMDAMASLRSPHIVHVYGRTTSLHDRLVLVMELLVGGDLQTMLKSSNQPLPAEQSRHIIGDVCAGMDFLHGENTVHGDLTSAKVLLDGAGRAKIGDFISTTWAEVSGLAAARSILWVAPEVLEGGATTYASDVYSFGVVVWEVITTEVPWATKTNPRDVVRAVLQGERPEFPAHADAGSVDVARLCWAHDVHTRPSFRELMEHMKIKI